MKGMRSSAYLTQEQRAEAAERLKRLIEVDPATGCHLFTGAVSYDGYATMYVARICFSAHRLAYELAHGPIPHGRLWVRHDCDVPRCCNPAHLRVGTSKDNAQDKALRARMRPGDRAKSTWQTEADINRPTGTVFYEYRGEVKPLMEWAAQFGVSHITLNQRFLAGWPEERIPRAPSKLRVRQPKSPRVTYRRFSGIKAVEEYLRGKAGGESD